MRLHLPSFPGFFLNISPSSLLTSSVGPFDHPEVMMAMRMASVCLELRTGGHVYGIVWSRASGWTPLIDTTIASDALVRPLRIVLSTWSRLTGVPVPDGLEEAILAVVPDEDVMAALEVMES